MKKTHYYRVIIIDSETGNEIVEQAWRIPTSLEACQEARRCNAQLDDTMQAIVQDYWE
jgi:hypothetical protein